MTYKKYLHPEDLTPALPIQTGNNLGVLSTDGLNTLDWKQVTDILTFNIPVFSADGTQATFVATTSSSIPVYLENGQLQYIQVGILGS